jgi:lipid A 3-O-deacylase
MRTFFLLFCFLFSSLSSSEKPKHLLAWGGGVFEIVRCNRHQTAVFQVEYRPPLVWYTVRPSLGFFLTYKGSTYLYGGFGLEWILKKRFLFSPNFAVGWYRSGGGKDLGYPLEFRSGVEGAFILKNQTRLGAQFYHISNASIGHKNPGEESLVFLISVPL